jgi:hypothetical protein
MPLIVQYNKIPFVSKFTGSNAIISGQLWKRLEFLKFEIWMRSSSQRKMFLIVKKIYLLSLQTELGYSLKETER